MAFLFQSLSSKFLKFPSKAWTKFCYWIYARPGTHLINILWAHNWNLINFFFSDCHSNDWTGQFTILHITWQLSCHAICKIVIWSKIYSYGKSNRFFHKIWIMSSKKCLWHWPLNMVLLSLNTVKPLIYDCTLVGNKIVDHSDYLEEHDRCYIFILKWIGQRQLQDEMRNI